MDRCVRVWVPVVHRQMFTVMQGCRSTCTWGAAAGSSACTLALPSHLQALIRRIEGVFQS